MCSSDLATKAEINETKEDGVIFDEFKTPVEITPEGAIFADTRLVTFEDGSTRLETIPGSEKLFPCDNVIIAVSQAPKNNIVAGTTGLKTRYGLLVTDDIGNTTRQGVFACGDVVSGAKTVIEAVVQAKKVANSMDDYLCSLPK